MFKSILNFFLWSSVNPDKISLTIKAGIPLIVSTLAVMNIYPDINPLADALINFITAMSMLVSAGVTMYGLIRKFSVLIKP